LNVAGNPAGTRGGAAGDASAAAAKAMRSAAWKGRAVRNLMAGRPLLDAPEQSQDIRKRAAAVPEFQPWPIPQSRMKNPGMNAGARSVSLEV
jgi:hypothetical protein